MYVKLQNAEITRNIKSIKSMIEKGKENQVTQTVEINDNIEAPIKKGDVIGKVVFSLDDSELSSTNLVASCDVDKITLFSMSKKIIYSWVDLLRS